VAPRTRIWLVASLACLVAATAAVLVAAHGRAGGEDRKPLAGAPPLFLDLGVRTDPEARALRRAAALYEVGKRTDAGAVFVRYDSVQARVGAALATWPSGSLAQLRSLAGLHPRDALVLLHVGYAQLWSGDTAAALDAFREAQRAQPDTGAALQAENALHPGLPAGRPLFEPSFPEPPALAALPAPRQLAYLRAHAHGNDVRARILYGVALARLGHRRSAERELQAAVRLAPNDPDALTGAAVFRFDKDDPSNAFKRLGPLARRFPRAPVVRFHLGLLLIWLGRSGFEQARTELQQVVRDAPASRYAPEARQLLAKLPTG
jgi:Flp pilus assembly protein TadD